MTTKTLILESVTRTTQAGHPETLMFERGVNVLVGRPNSGKTAWLTMIDFLLGETDPPPKALGAAISDKYSSIRASVIIGGVNHTFERRWKDSKIRTKILIDDEPLSTSEFSSQLLEMLDVPEVHYPKGNP